MLKYLIILGLVILAWCPWLTAKDALNIVDAKVLQMQQDIPDLCEMSLNKKSIMKVPFGYTEEVSYDCTATDDTYGILKSRNAVFITFYKGLLGMPHKKVKSNF